ncbi:hypothetical protein C8R45DRAFT_1219049 [Mycena sanguinolenta]|nr:hypothetical protein C8R45DRAFT_1219049 [Mycena sanguinolenta]
MSLPLHKQPMRVAIVAENFLPKIDGSTITLSHLLTHLSTLRIPTLLLGPSSPLTLTNTSYAGAFLFGTPGVPLPSYPGLKINFLTPSFLSTLRAFKPTVIHIVDPIWLGVQSLAALTLLFPDVPIVSSHHTNLPTYTQVFGYPYWTERVWGVHTWLHSFARCTLVPSASTKQLLEGRGWGNLKVVGRGVDEAVFHPSHRSPTLRASWGAAPHDVVILSVGRLSPEKNLVLLVHAYAALVKALKAFSNADAHVKTHLVFIGDGPFRASLQALCTSLGVRAIFTGQLTGVKLGEAVASADVLSSPSITETFGQVTLQGMAAGLPVVGLYVEGTADLVRHGVRGSGLLLDPLITAPGPHAHAAGLVEGAAWMDMCDEPAPAALDVVSARLADEDDEEIPVPDSAVCLSPMREGDVAGLGGRGSMSMEELVLPAAARDDPPTFCPSPTPGTPEPLSADEEEDPFFSPYPSEGINDEGGKDGEGKPRVGCFRTLAPLMRPDAPAFPAIVQAYAGLMAGLVRSPALRAAMGKRAHARSTRFRWTECSQRVVDAYVDACRPRDSVPSSSKSPPSASASASTSFFGFATSASKAPQGDLEAQTQTHAPDIKRDDPDVHAEPEVQEEEGEEQPESRPLLGLVRRARRSALSTAHSSNVTALGRLIGGGGMRGLGLVTGARRGGVGGVGIGVGGEVGVGGMGIGSTVERAAAGWTWVVDAVVVVHALVAATLSHAAYMVPAAEDVWGRGPGR